MPHFSYYWHSLVVSQKFENASSRARCEATRYEIWNNTGIKRIMLKKYHEAPRTRGEKQADTSDVPALQRGVVSSIRQEFL